MDEIRDEMLADAIKTALDYSLTIIKLKRIIIVLSVIIIALVLGYIV